MKPVSFTWKRFFVGMALCLLASAPPVAAQSTVTVQFGPTPDVAVGETVEVPVLARRMQQTRAAQVQVLTRGDRLQWTDVVAGEGAGGMEVIDWKAEGDTLDVVLSHLDSEAQTTLLRSAPILLLRGERTADGLLPLSFADVPVAVVALDLSTQDVEYGPATATDADRAVPTSAFRLLGTHPNPFRDRTRVSLEVPEAASATLTIYDLLGREVARQAYSPVGPGVATLDVQVPRAASGTYLYRVRLDGPSGRREASGMMTILK